VSALPPPAEGLAAALAADGKPGSASAINAVTAATTIASPPVLYFPNIDYQDPGDIMVATLDDQGRAGPQMPLYLAAGRVYEDLKGDRRFDAFIERPETFCTPIALSRVLSADSRASASQRAAAVLYARRIGHSVASAVVSYFTGEGVKGHNPFSPGEWAMVANMAASSGVSIGGGVAQGPVGDIILQTVHKEMTRSGLGPRIAQVKLTPWGEQSSLVGACRKMPPARVAAAAGADGRVWVAGVDLGGTRIKSALMRFRAAAGMPESPADDIHGYRVTYIDGRLKPGPTPIQKLTPAQIETQMAQRSQLYDLIADRLVAAIQTAPEGVPLASDVVVSIPGEMDPTTGEIIKGAHQLPYWSRDNRIRDEIRTRLAKARLDDFEVHVENDGNCAALTAEGVYLGLGTCVAGGFARQDPVSTGAPEAQVRATAGAEAAMLFDKTRRELLLGNVDGALAAFKEACSLKQRSTGDAGDGTQLQTMESFWRVLRGEPLGVADASGDGRGPRVTLTAGSARNDPRTRKLCEASSRFRDALDGLEYDAARTHLDALHRLVEGTPLAQAGKPQVEALQRFVDANQQAMRIRGEVD
jgi:hypothetical protein